MKTIKKLVSLFLPVVMVLQIVAVTPVVSSASGIDPSAMSFEEYLVAQFENYATQIELEYYVRNNPQWLREATSNVNAFSRKLSQEVLKVIDENPQLIHIKAPARCSVRISYSLHPNGTVSNLTVIASGFEYSMTKAEYNRNKQRFDQEVQRALNYAASAQTDFEKALAIHDYIVLNTSYDKENLDYAIRNNNVPLRSDSHTAFGPLVNNLSVCDGYARAYMYLMKELGMECNIVEGKLGEINHVWNVVKIDGRWFNVDTTANDPLFDNIQDLHGLVSHRYFLLSDAALRREGTHSGWNTSLTKANSTMYDKAFFRSANSAVIKLGDAFYWLASDVVTGIGVNNNHIRKFDMNTRKTSTVHSFESVWFRDGTENSNEFRFSNASFSRLAAYNGRLYFNTAKEIRSFDPATSKSSVIARPEGLGGTGNRFIFGITMRGNALTYTVKTTAARPDNFVRIAVPAATSTAIEMSRNSATLAAGETLEIRSRLTPSNSTDFIFWVSSDLSVATVNASGVVTAVKSGTATITAFTETGKRAVCRVTVS